jgi:hypothetical protein
MNTIRDEIRGFVHFESWEVLTLLGIDPDLPAEWATVDRCLAWLREQRQMPLTISVPPGGAGTVWLRGVPCYGATLHRALVAACKMVQAG